MSETGVTTETTFFDLVEKSDKFHGHEEYVILSTSYNYSKKNNKHNPQ